MKTANGHTTTNFLNRCARLSMLYEQRFMAMNLRLSGDVMNDPWASLKFFLRGYAFERKGRSTDYAAAAVDAAQEVEDKPLRVATATSVWKAFGTRLDGYGLNHMNNPLCPRGCRYGTAGQRRTTGKSVIEMAAGIPGQQPLMAWSSAMLRTGDVKVAHARLKDINGIGPKIASFFLRDVATYCGIQLSDERELLQPIDTWMRFVARQVSRNGSMTDTACARLIVQKANEPERANQGIWYLCAQVAQSSQYRVKQAIEDSSKLTAAVADHLDRLAAVNAVAKRLRRTLGELA